MTGAEADAIGGRAFPHGGSGHLGMSLRDYFAAHALAGLLSSEASGGEGHIGAIYEGGLNRPAHLFAVLAYQIADAMLAERLH